MQAKAFFCREYGLYGLSKLALLCPFFAKISSKSGKVSSSGIELIDKLCLVSDFLSIFAG